MPVSPHRSRVSGQLRGVSCLVGILAAAGCHSSGDARGPEARGDGLAAHFVACTQHVEHAAWPELRRDCLADRFVAREMDAAAVPDASALVAQLDALRATFPDLHVAPQLVLAADHRVFAVVRITGTQQGVLHAGSGDLPASGRRIGVLAVCDVVLDAAGRATDASVYLDRLAVIGQLGALPEGFDPTRPALDGSDAPPVLVSQRGDPTERANAAVLRTFTDAVNAHRTADVLALAADNIVDSDAGQPADRSGAEVRQMYTGLLQNVPDYHREVPAVFAIGDYVVAPGVKTGTWGKSKVKLHYVEVLRLERGKIVENRRFYDVLAMVEQITAGAR